VAVGCPHFVAQPTQWRIRVVPGAMRREGRNGKEVVEKLETVAFF
jgi:hypothetical protein